MEYLVLARKWRPQIFEDVVGQDHVVQTLRNAIRLDRIAHAYIFSGPRGIGKTSVARILSKALNCEKGPLETPCNECIHCREITAGISMDVREIDGASNRGIDEIRELRENIKFSSASARYKIYIIDEVHMLTKEAFNALLKTIEEPPPHVIFIFATTEINKVPATILSRCQSHDFRRVSLKQLREHLRKIADAEGIQISENGLEQIADAGEGSLRDAESIFDQVIAYAGHDIKDAEVEEILGISDRKLLYDLSAAVLDRNGQSCLRLVDEAYFAGIDMKFLYQKMVRHFLNLLVSKIVGRNPEAIDLPDDEAAEREKQISGVSRQTIQRLLDILMTEEEEVRRNPDPRLILEFVLLKMTYLDPLIPINEMVSRMEDLERRLLAEESGIDVSQPVASARDSAPSVKSRNGQASYGIPEDAGGGAGKTAETAPSAPMKTYGTEGSFWDRFSAFVKQKDQPLWSKVVQGTFLGYEQNELTIGFPKGSILPEMIDKEKLSGIAGDFCGAATAIKIDSVSAPNGQKDLATGNGMADNRSQQHIRREALQHPLVQKVIDIFEGAEVKEVIAKKQ